MKKLSFAFASLLFSFTAQASHIEHVSLGFDHKLAGVLKESFSVDTKDMSCTVVDGQFSNGAAFDLAEVSVTRITTQDRQVVTFERPITAGLLPGPQGTCDLFEYAIEGKQTIQAEYSGDVATRLYDLKGINDPRKW